MVCVGDGIGVTSKEGLFAGSKIDTSAADPGSLVAGVGRAAAKAIDTYPTDDAWCDKNA